MGVVVMASHTSWASGVTAIRCTYYTTCTVRARSTFEYTHEVRTNQTDLVLMWENLFCVTFIASSSFYCK